MSNILNNRLGKYITKNISQYSRPKTKQDYDYNIKLSTKIRPFIYSLLDPKIDTLSFYINNNYNINKNMGYRGYSLDLGNYLAESKLLIILDEFPFTISEIILINDNNHILKTFSIDMGWCLATLYNKEKDYMYFTITQRNKLNPKEIENWDKLQNNIICNTNILFDKYIRNKLPMGFTYLIDNR